MVCLGIGNIKGGFINCRTVGMQRGPGGSINYVNRQGSKNTVVAICTFGKKIGKVGFFKKSSLSREGLENFLFFHLMVLIFFKKMIFFKKREKNARTFQ